MKNIILTVSVLSFMAASACAGAAKGGASVKQRVQYKSYTMDNGYFSCDVPSSWTLAREKEKDEEYKIYEIQLLAPAAGKAPTSVFVSYYGKDNEDFDGYEDFIRRNSRNVAGETKSPREKFDPVKKAALGKRKGFELSRERLVYLFPESKSEESVRLLEKLYVLPAAEGFYVLHFSASQAAFQENLPVFEAVLKSFKGKP